MSSKCWRSGSRTTYQTEAAIVYPLTDDGRGEPHRPYGIASQALMDSAVYAATRSPNRSRKTGVALLTAAGHLLTACNTFPPGVADQDERHEGEARYRWIEHAERNAIHLAARRGQATEGSVMVTPWFPCVECARAIVGAGIGELVCTEPDWSEERYHFRTAETILLEGGVKVRYFTGIMQ